MAEQNQIYKCNVCGNIVQVLHTGAGELVCCGQPMELFKEKTEDVGQEKHVPVIEKISSGHITTDRNLRYASPKSPLDPRGKIKLR